MTESLDASREIARIATIAAVPTILDVVCRVTGMGFAAVARVTDDRWIVCSVLDSIGFGLGVGGELKVETTICHEIRQSREAVIIDHVAEDPGFCGHHTPAQYGFQSYISMPIILPDGRFWGTLCAIDPKPAKLRRPDVVGMFKLFAELIAFHLDAQERLSESEANLKKERAEAELREQFIAVLGHDLRNPLAAVDAGANLLMRGELDQKARKTIGLVKSATHRMVGLVDNILDFARGRLGGGMPIAKVDASPKAVIDQVVAEIRAASPERDIQVEGDFDCTIAHDPTRMAQLLSNLLGNAVMHGDTEAPIRVQANIAANHFELAVVNSGEPIARETLPKLFLPFVRAAQPGQGLGLGLYIASEIAKAHGGELDVLSLGRVTRFSFKMPLK